MRHFLRFPDLLDLEWFLKQDEAVDPWAAAERDRAIGLKALDAKPSEAPSLDFWLEERRRSTPGPLPSTLFRSTRVLTGWVLGLAGLLAGTSLARALLAYSGQDPINVFLFLLAVVAPQTLLCLVSCVFLLLRRPLPLPVLSVLALAWRAITRRVGRARHLMSMPVMFPRHGRHGRLLFWEAVRLSHLAGSAFAAGALASLLVGVAATDLAFGWQSTLRAGADGVHRVVSILSWPWSLAPASWNMTPTLDQIEGSRIILKDGAAALANADLAAWWPFLAMCLLVYALLPRLGLWLVARLGLARLERSFAHPDQGRIEDRMRAPLFGARETLAEGPSAPLPLEAKDRIDRPMQSALKGEVGCVVLVPEELAGRIPHADLDRLASGICGYPAGRVVSLELDADGARTVAEVCAGLVWTGGFERFVLVVEAWQPPIREALLAVAALGRDNAAGRSVHVALVGRPAGGAWLTAPTDTERRIWTEALARLNPLRITVFPVEES